MPATYEEIAVLAYPLWKERGEPIGSSEVDWERAELTLQVQSTKWVKTAVTDIEASLPAGGAGDEMLAEKAAGLSPDGTSEAQAQQSPEQSSKQNAPRSRAKTPRRKTSASSQRPPGSSL